MARLWIVCLLIFHGLLTTTTFPSAQKNYQESTQTEQPQLEFGKLLSKIIDYLQEDPNRIYFYKDYLVFDVKKKDSSIDVQLQVKIICIKEEQCADTAYLICNASLPENGNTYIFDGSVSCDPVAIKADLSTSTTGVPVIVIEPVSSEQQKQDALELSHEITSQISGEQFIATPLRSQPSQDPYHLSDVCTGCVETVSPTAIGVDELVDSAMRHIETDGEVGRRPELVRVVKVERQIIAGVKYSVLLEVTDAEGGCMDDDSVKSTKYCKINFINRPWINKSKNIVSNNCTVSQTYPLLEVPNREDPNSDDMDNEIDVNNPYKPQQIDNDNQSGKPYKPNYDKMATSGNLDENTETLMTPDRLAFLESQIIMEQFTPETRTTEEVPKVQQTTVDNTQMAVDDIPSIFMMDEPGGKISDTDEVRREVAQDINVAKRHTKIPAEEQTSDVKSTSSSEEQITGGTAKVTQTDSSEESSEEHPKQVIKRFIPDSSEESSESVEDQYQQRTKRDISSGSRRRVLLQNSYQRNNNLNCPHLLQEFTQLNSENNLNSVSKFSNKLHVSVVHAIHKLAADHEEFMLIEDMHSFNWDPIRFNVIVSIFKCGQLNRELYDRLQCTPDFSEVLRKEIVTVEVQYEEASVHATYDLSTCEQQHHPLTSHSRQPRGIPGGQSSLSVDDSQILSLVRSTLAQLDAESAHDTKYKLVEVLEASSQVVAGSLYRIKVKIVPSDCLKSKDVDPQSCGDLKESASIICNMKIWDRPWLPNGRETNITCTEIGKNARPQLHNFRSKRQISHQSDSQLLLDNIHQMQTKQLSNRLRFAQFQVMYNRQYTDTAETAMRARLFARNMALVKKNLASNTNDFATYGPSKFADIDPEEFKRTYLGLNPPTAANLNVNRLPQATIPTLASMPNAIDWRTEGIVTAVKNQGACGSCWAFSVTGNVEGQYALQHHQLLEFSEQELVDCDRNDNGCSGGLMTDAYMAIEKLGGLETEQDYPYDAEEEQCHFNKSLVKVHVVNAVNISQDEDDMAKWLVKNGPISIGINANAMQFYMGGVSHPWKLICNPTDLDHGVLIVGYGVSKNAYFNSTKPFWIVKNSWGGNWGEQGYYRVYRGDGTCGVNQMASSAVVD